MAESELVEPELVRTEGLTFGFGWLKKDSRKFYSPYVNKNQGPVLEILQQYCKAEDTILEVAAGSGQHAAYFATKLKGVKILPTEHSGFPSPMSAQRQNIDEILGSIKAYTEDLPNVLEPVALDVENPQAWTQFSSPFQGVLCINCLHISEISVARALFDGSGTVLAPDCYLFIYGAVKFTDGPPTPESNAEFDDKLKEMNPAYGIRNVQDLDVFAAKNKLKRVGTHERPANNYVLVYQKEQ